MNTDFICLNDLIHIDESIYMLVLREFELSETFRQWKGTILDKEIARCGFYFATPDELYRAYNFIFKYLYRYSQEFQYIIKEPENFKEVWMIDYIDMNIFNPPNIQQIKYQVFNSIHKFKFENGLLYKTENDAQKALNLIKEILIEQSKKSMCNRVSSIYDSMMSLKTGYL